MEQTDQAVRPRPDAQQSLLLQVSNEMVRLYKDLFGRGPTRARTDWAGPDTLLCTLRDSFTPAERNLAKMGEHQRLRDTRLFVQYATQEEFAPAIERVVDRKVVGMVSGVDTHEDISTEVFYLKPFDAPQ